MEEDPVKNLAKIVDKNLKVLRDKTVINEENYGYLRGKDHKLGRFYLLPKIQKRLVNVPGRLMVSNCVTATEKLPEFVDFNLQPIEHLYLFPCWRKNPYKQKNLHELFDLLNVGTFELSFRWVV